jgi:hypothetical protein
MADTPPDDEQKVHDIIPDTLMADAPSPTPRRTSIAGHAARPRPCHIPRSESESYPSFKAKQECALLISLKEFAREFSRSTGVTHTETSTHTLTVHHSHSQSKLSQQELLDLQKATHFDKKELQQWYKGVLLEYPQLSFPC